MVLEALRARPQFVVCGTVAVAEQATLRQWFQAVVAVALRVQDTGATGGKGCFDCQFTVKRFVLAGSVELVSHGVCTPRFDAVDLEVSPKNQSCLVQCKYRRCA